MTERHNTSTKLAQRFWHMQLRCGWLVAGRWSTSWPLASYRFHPSSRPFPVVFLKDDDCVPPSTLTLNNSTDRIWTAVTVDCDVRRHLTCAGRQVDHFWQDRWCTCNVTLRHVRATIFLVEKLSYCIFWVGICSLRYPACNTYAPSFLWRVRLYSIFPHLINGRILENIIEHKMCVLIVYRPTFFDRSISRSKKNWARMWWKMCIGLHVKYPLFLSDFNL